MMMRKVATIVFLFVLSFTTIAQAEHKLLPTDVLDAKQVEAAAGVSYGHSKLNFTNSSGSGSIYGDSLGSSYSLGVGLGYGLQLSASIPYHFFNKSKYEYNNNVASYNSDQSSRFGDLGLSAKYLILDEKKYPFALTAGLGVQFIGGEFNAANGSFSSNSTAFKPYLNASKKMGENFIPYINYQAYISSNGDYQNNHFGSLGAEIKLNQTISLVPEFAVRFFNESNRYSSSVEYAFQLSSFIQAFHNFYLVPSLGISKETSYRYKLNTNQYDPQYSAGGGFAFYYLW